MIEHRLRVARNPPRPRGVQGLPSSPLHAEWTSPQPRLKMAQTFDEQIQDRARSVVADLTHPGKPILLAFGGIAGRMAAISPFEFFRLTRNLQVNKVYLRDLDQCWYHAGLRGESQDIPSTARYLKSLVDACRTKVVVAVGSSMGGYAALLFGAMVGASSIHAFSPHVFLGDTRSIRKRERLAVLHDRFDGDHFDVNTALDAFPDGDDRNVYLDARNRKDRRQIGFLKDHPNLRLHAFPGGGHNLVKYLKAAGELEKVIDASLAGRAYAPRKDIPLRRSLLARLLGRRVA